MTEKKRLFIITGCIVAAICLIAFLRVQVDDERYFNLYDFIYADEDRLDFSDGVVHAVEGRIRPGDEICRLPTMHLEDGAYILQIDHQQDTDSKVVILDGDREIESFILPASELETKLSFTTDKDLYNMTAEFSYGGGEYTLKHAYLRAPELFYTDTIAFAVILILSVFVLVFIIIKKDLLSLPHREKIFYLSFPAFFVFLNYAYFRELGGFFTNGDGGFLAARIEQTCNELLRGQFPVQIYGDGLDGHGVLGSLYPNLFLYFPAFLRICHVSIEAVLRITWMTVNAATMFTSYYALKRLSGNRIAAFLGMVVYTTLPYRLGVLYFRAAMGELLAMLFIPLVILGLYEIFVGDRKRWIVLALGISGILQSHVLSTVMIMGFCILMGIFLVRYLFRDRRWLSLLKAVFLTLFLNVWFLLPYLEYYTYDLMLEEMFAVLDFSEVSNHPSQFFTLFASFANVTENYSTPMLGPAVWIFIGMLIYFCLFMKAEDDRDHFIRGLFVTGTLFLFMSSRWFPWQTLSKFEAINQLVQMIQFPVRFGQIAQAALAISGVLILFKKEVFSRHAKKTAVFCLISSCFLMIIISDSWIRTLPNEPVGILKLTPGYQNISYEDYAPAGYDAESYKDVPVGEAQVTGWTKDGTRAGFDYTSEKDTFIDLPVTAYPGYRAFDLNGTELSLEKGDHAMLRVNLPATSEALHVKVVYMQPVRWRIALIISVLTVILMAVLTMREKRKEKNA